MINIIISVILIFLAAFALGYCIKNKGKCSCDCSTCDRSCHDKCKNKEK